MLVVSIAERYVMEGGEMPAVLPALPDDTDREPASATPEVAAVALAAVRDILAAEPPVRWREDRGRWVATIRTACDLEARATVTPTGDGDPWRWTVMIAGDVIDGGFEPDAEASKEAAMRCAVTS